MPTETDARTRLSAHPVDRLITNRVDGAGLGAFRALFGALLFAAVVRFALKGWIDAFYVAPDFRFSYLGFGWVRPLPAPWIYVHFAALGACALALCVGWRARWAAAGVFVLFTWVELLDKSLYLNHYYLVSLLSFLLIWLPSDAAFSVSRRPARQVLAWSYTVLRGQMLLVYVFAGLAKLNADWLVRGEPLATWLSAHAHWPWVGPLLSAPMTPLAMSWAGAAFDLTIAFWLMVPRTRPWAYAVAVVFHVSVWLMFPIGVFSWVMLVSATVFFAPDWPRRWMNGAAGVPAAPRTSARTPRLVVAAIAIWLAVQLAVPLRFAMYPGRVNWTEEGFRFAWRVMLIEKTGVVEFRVVRPDGMVRVHPNAELPPHQAKALRTQPDMILEYAHVLAERYTEDGTRPQVFADAWVSWNGRMAAQLIDPAVDLAAQPRTLRAADWILPAP